MVVALVLSGGHGSRLGSDIPKQYIKVGGIPIISYSIATLSRSDEINAIWIVAEKEWHERIMKFLKDSKLEGKFKGFSQPGLNRQLSIYNGILDIKKTLSDTEYVFIHDAVRPLLTSVDIKNCVDGLKGHDGVIPVLPMKDTVYLSTDGKSVTKLLPREQVFSGQAPELFDLDKYLKANERLINRNKSDGVEIGEISTDSVILKINGSTEPAVMAGMDIVMVQGSESNFKITTRADLERFETIIYRSVNV